MSEKTVNRLLAFGVLFFSFIIYFMTMAPTVSLWDCGEFIACAYRLSVPHPPGAPFYLLVGRIFSMIPIFENIAARINLISVLSSSITVMLLYYIIVYFGRKVIKGESFIDKVSIYGGGVVGSLTFAFTHSFWFNAVEAEVYAASMFFTALVVYLIMRWEERADSAGNERYLLMIFYIVGLATGVHLLNVLALPFVFLIYFYRKYEFTLKNFLLFVVIGGGIFGIIYPGIIFGVPLIASRAGLTGLIGVILLIFALFLWSRKSHQILSTSMLSILLILIGYSTYVTVYVRSNQNPNIDENNPETIENFVSYLNREQYGEHTLNRKKVLEESANGSRYSGVGDFFWNYQINKMYVRYFLWQYLGMSEDEVNVDGLRYFGIPFILGLLGLIFQLSRDKKGSFAVFALFFMTGLAIILYLNQPDPQPRERDYSYVGSFFAFAVWIGLGAGSLIQWLKELEIPRKNILGVALAVLLLVASPVQMLAKDMYRQNRRGNYLAWDHSYNMLMSCRKDAILFTYGDNDTFPLWYLQEVEGIRTDVRIVNLQLLNTPWYIYQLKHLEPKIDVGLSDKQIEKIQQLVFSKPWKKTKIKIAVPKELQKEEAQLKLRQMAFVSGPIAPDTSGYIEFSLNPKVKIQGYGFLRVQDYMILKIIHANKWKKPICFSFTMPTGEMLDDLKNYLQLDGLVYRLTSQRNWPMDNEHLAELFGEVFKFRNLNNPDIHYLPEQEALVNNYWGIFFKMNSNLIAAGEIEKATQLLRKMHEEIDLNVIPIKYSQNRLFDRLQMGVTGIIPADSALETVNNPGEGMQIAKLIIDLYHKSPYAADLLNTLRLKFEKDKIYGSALLESYYILLDHRGEREKLHDEIAAVLQRDKSNKIALKWKRKVN